MGPFVVMLIDRIRAGEVDPSTQTLRQMATILDTSPNYVGAVLRAAGIIYRTQYEDDLDAVNRMLQEARRGKKTTNELAGAFGLCYLTVHNHLTELGIKVPATSPRKTGGGATASAIVDAEGVSIGIAALRVGCTPQAVRKYRHKRGLSTRVRQS